MNKKMSKALAVALSAAMAASAFAIGTGSAFAAPTAETAKATLAATKSVPEYLWNDNDTDTTNDNTVDDVKVDLKKAYGTTLKLLDGATLTLEDGSEVAASSASLSNATFTTDDNTLVTLDNGKLAAVAGAEGTAQITISGATATATNGTTYDVDPFTVDVDVIAPNDYSEGVWTKDSAATITNEVNVGDTVSLYEATAKHVQTGSEFATFEYTQLLTDKGTPAKGTFSESSAKKFDAVELKGSAFTAVKAGSGTVDYYASNKAVEDKNPTAKASQELTVQGAYSNVSSITKENDGTYDVKAGTATINLTADELANGTFQLADSVKGIYNADGATVSGGIKIDTKLGTVEAAASSFTVRGVEIDTVKSTADSGYVTIENTANTKTKQDIPATVGTVDSANVIVGATTSTTASISVDSIVADNVTVNTNKAEIGAITPKKTAGTVTTDKEKGIKLPALDGYGLTINVNTTVASIANAQASTIANTATLTVSGTAEFKGQVTSGGTIAIAPASLTIVGDSSKKDAFTLALTEVKAGATAFKTTSAKVTKGDYTDNGSNGKNALTNIKTPGYTAVADGNGNAVIDKTIVAGGVKDATPGAVYDAKNNVYKLEINDDEPTTLALQPIYADSLSKNQTVTWALSGKGISSGNVTLNNKTTGSLEGGLTATVIGDYQKNYSDRNKFTVTATMGSTTVTYDITIVNEKTTPTTDFSLSLGANYVQPGETMEVYATPNGNESLKDVTFSSSDPSVATVQSTAQVKNVYSAKIAGVKNGTATIMAVATLQNGQKITKTIDVTVTSTPVLAYIDGKLVNPTDTIDVAQSTSKDVTFFSVNGKTIDSFNYVTGNGKVIGTNTLNVWNGISGAYQVYAAGKVGEATGVYVNGQKVFVAKVTERPFTSDTTMNVNLPVGKTYSFKISLKDKSAPFTFSTANGAALSTSYNKAYYPDANGDYICTIKAEKAVGGVGVYVNIAGVNYKVFTAVTQ